VLSLRGVDVDDIPREAARGKLLPVYLLGGEERFLVTRALEAIRTAVVGNGPRGLAEDIFDGRGTDARTVIEACRTLPMMAKRRLVLVRGVDQMSTTEQEALIPYLSAPVDSTVLVLVAVTLDARRKIALEAKKRGCLFVAQHPSEQAVGHWLEREAKARGATLEPGAVESLSLAVGPDLSLLSDALDRLLLFTNGAAVTAHDVDTVVTAVREVPAWDLAEAVAARNLPATLSILARLTAQRQHALPTLGMIARQVHQIARAHTAMATGGPSAVADELKIPTFIAQKLTAQARKWTAPQLSRALRILAATDAALKGAKRDDARILEECVLALCGGPGMGEPAQR